MSEKKRFRLELLLFSLVFLSIYYPVLTKVYGVSDDFYITWIADPTFFHPLAKSAIFLDGRPLNGLWKIITYIFVDRIDEQWPVRLIALGVVTLSAVILATLLRCRFGFKTPIAYGFSLIVFTLPGFSSFIIWQTAAVCSMGAMLGLVSGVLSLRGIDRIVDLGWSLKIAGGLAAAILIQVAAMLFYHPAAMFFGIVSLLVLLFDGNTEINKKIIRLIAHGALLGIAIIVFYLSVKAVSGSMGMFGDFTFPKSFHGFSIDLSLSKNRTAMFQLDYTGMAFWLVDGSYQINQFIHVIFAASLLFHIAIFWRELSGQMPIRRTVIYATCYVVALFCLIYVLPNLINVFAPTYNFYTRHTVVFSTAYLLLFARVLCDLRSTVPALYARFESACHWVLIAFFAIVIVIVAWRAEVKTTMHANDWHEILTDMSSLSQEVEKRDLNIKISMPPYVYKRWGIGAATRDIPTHGLLMFLAAFAQHGWLQENYRTEMGLSIDNLTAKALRMRFITKSGTNMVIDFETEPYKLKTDLKYDYAFAYQNLTSAF